MMEQKLQQAANALPQHNEDFLAVEEAFKKRQSRPCPKPRRRFILVLCLSLLLVGCVAGPTVPEYHLYNGNLNLLFPGIAFDVLCEEMGWDPELNSAEKAAEEQGWTLPETLGNSPLYNVDKLNLTTEKSHWFTAMLFHHYSYYSTQYGFDKETEITREDGTSSTAYWTDGDVDVMFGSTENPIWRRQFGFDENDVYIGFPDTQQAEDSGSLYYEGITLYVRTYRYDDNFYDLLSYYGQQVCWVDTEHNTVFSLYSRDDSPNFIIECAKELIDHIH